MNVYVYIKYVYAIFNLDPFAMLEKILETVVKFDVIKIYKHVFFI